MDEFWTSLDKFGQVWTCLDKFDKFGRVWTSLDKVSGEFSRQLGIAEVADYLKTTLYDKKLNCLNGKK